MTESQIKFDKLRIQLQADDDGYSLSLLVSSGFVDLDVTISVNQKDFEVIKKDRQRAAFIQAALNHPFQLRETRLNDTEQRYYLDKVLHASEEETEHFLTDLDTNKANGAVSNMVNITCDNQLHYMKPGQWFAR